MHAHRYTHTHIHPYMWNKDNEETPQGNILSAAQLLSQSEDEQLAVEDWADQWEVKTAGMNRGSSSSSKNFVSKIQIYIFPNVTLHWMSFESRGTFILVVLMHLLTWKKKKKTTTLIQVMCIKSFLRYLKFSKFVSTTELNFVAAKRCHYNVSASHFYYHLQVDKAKLTVSEIFTISSWLKFLIWTLNESRKNFFFFNL